MSTAAGAWVLTGGAWKRKGQADRTAGVAPFVLGSTKPTRANSGLPPGWVPTTTYTTTQTVTTNGATYTDCRFDNYVDIRASDVTFVRCEFRGPSPGPASTNSAAKCTDVATLRTRFEFCDFIARSPTNHFNALSGHDYTAHRCYVKNFVDGFNVYNTAAPGAASNVRLEGNCVELLSYFSPDPTQSDNATHNDCVQHQGGSGTVIVGNTLAGFVDPAVGNANEPPTTDGSGNHTGGYRYSRSPIPDGFWANAAIQFNNNVGNSMNVTVDRNWIDGGGASINVPSTACTGLAITGNRFGQHARLGSGFNIIAPSALVITVTGNVDESTGAAANHRANG